MFLVIRKISVNPRGIWRFFEKARVFRGLALVVERGALFQGGEALGLYAA